MGKITWRKDYYYILIVILLFVAIYGLLPQLSYFKDGVEEFKHPNWDYIVAAVIAACLTVPAAAFTYYVLAFKPIAYMRTVFVQLANNFADRLLPAGIGGIGLSYIYLKNNRHSNSQAAAVVTTNNLAGSFGHMILAILVLFALPSTIDGSWFLKHLQINPFRIFIFLCALFVLVAVLALFRGRLSKGLKKFFQNLSSYRRRPKKLILAVASSMILTICNIVGLYFISKSYGAGLSILEAFIIFSLGLVIGIAIPTPGGIGGIEAGLVAGMIAFGVSAPLSLTVVLTYRLISCWLPAIIGGVAFVVSERRGYLKF